jgi:four helix bundle protein
MKTVIKSFRDLQVWQRAHELVLLVYQVTENFPEQERFGITAQLRRSAASIPANIAEGYGRRTTRELLQSLAVANGSLEETRYFLLLSSDLKYLESDAYNRLSTNCDSVGQMLGALVRSLKKLPPGPHGARATVHEAR